ncbi:uncharacterized protein [Prorops nasuta]|uniref:uncharacterized protein isoform X2 n=1 Tax=Prorops nasuta TaxID=863751 RepID=UPI0034CEEA0A
MELPVIKTENEQTEEKKEVPTEEQVEKQIEAKIEKQESEASVPLMELQQQPAQDSLVPNASTTNLTSINLSSTILSTQNSLLEKLQEITLLSREILAEYNSFKNTALNIPLPQITERLNLTAPNFSLENLEQQIPIPCNNTWLEDLRKINWWVDNLILRSRKLLNFIIANPKLESAEIRKLETQHPLHQDWLKKDLGQIRSWLAKAMTQQKEIKNSPPLDVAPLSSNVILENPLTQVTQQTLPPYQPAIQQSEIVSNVSQYTVTSTTSLHRNNGNMTISNERREVIHVSHSQNNNPMPINISNQQVSQNYSRNTDFIAPYRGGRNWGVQRGRNYRERRRGQGQRRHRRPYHAEYWLTDSIYYIRHGNTTSLFFNRW